MINRDKLGPNNILYLFHNIPTLNWLEKSIIDFDMEAVNIYHNSYFENRLTLFQNLEFHFNFKNKSIHQFITKFKYEDFYEKNRNIQMQKISFIESKKISLLTYLYLNNEYLLYDINLIMILKNFSKDTRDAVEDYLFNNKINLFMKMQNNNSVINLEKFFKKFIIIRKETNKFEIFYELANLIKRMQVQKIEIL